MRPIGDVARRADYYVMPCPHAAGVALIREHHYAKGCSNTGLMHGLFLRKTGALVGVAQWLPPTRVCAESVDRSDWRRVISLSRLVVAPGQPKNSATLLLGASLRILRAERRHSWAVTFADESQGHTGAIYRASNWTYVGKTKPEARWLDSDGRQVSRKRANISRTVAEMRALGLLLAGRFSKHKFITPLG